MIKPNPERAAALLLGPKMESEEEHAAPDDASLRPIAQDLIDAVKAGDVDGVMTALKAAHATLDVPAE